MKTTRTLLLALTLSGVFVGTGSAQTSISAGIHIGPSGRTSVDLGFFYDDLAPYGNWVQRPQYGWVWRPHVERSSWRPYEDGHWAWTDEGWTWISDEPYGWATYHYGRWYDDPDYGWEWIPGEEWAPAWVSWQESDDYIGWAPLPPSVSFRPGVTLNVRLSPDLYVFVPSRQFLAPRVVDYVVPRAQYGRIFPRTRNVTRYNRINNRIFNQGVAVERIQRVTGRTVTRYQITDERGNDRHRGARIVQNRVTVFRPQVQRVKVTPPNQRPAWKRAQETHVQAQAPRVLPDRRGQVQQQRAEVERQRAQENRQQARNQQRQAEAHQQRAQTQQQKAQAERQKAQMNRQQARNQQRQAQAHQQKARENQQKAHAQRQKGNQGTQGKPHDNHKQKPPQ